MINILVVCPVPPDVKIYSTELFKNLLDCLRDKIEIHLTWLVISPTKTDWSSHNNSEITILDFNNYNNAVEVINDIKPDLIYSQPAFSPVEYAFLLAGKFLGVPVISGEMRSSPRLYQQASRIEIFRAQINQLFQSSIPGSTRQDQKLFMGRGRFFIRKYFFVIRTQQAMKMNRLQMLREFIFDFRSLFLMVKLGKPNVRFSCDLNFLDAETHIDNFIKAGYDRSSLIITGDPTYDSIFQNLKKLKTVVNKDEIRILVITTNPNDTQGHRTRRLRDYWIKTIAGEVSKHKNKMSLVIKIHPSGEILSEYQTLVNSIDMPIKIFQKGNIIDFIESSDVVIGWSSSTALVLSLLARKPVIIWNIFGVKNDLLLGKELAIKCKGSESVVESIHRGVSSNPASEDKINEFIEHYFYKFDGKATERIAIAILDFLKERGKIIAKQT